MRLFNYIYSIFGISSSTTNEGGFSLDNAVHRVAGRSSRKAIDHPFVFVQLVVDDTK